MHYVPSTKSLQSKENLTETKGLMKFSPTINIKQGFKLLAIKRTKHLFTCNKI